MNLCRAHWSGFTVRVLRFLSQPRIYAATKKANQTYTHDGEVVESIEERAEEAEVEFVEQESRRERPKLRRDEVRARRAEGEGL